ncbi:protein YgfX [Methylotenera sp.]|uniref:protein YgfX n=1 Tax=Methylotenera sp. TaxID=2051956 RepID=UPI002AB85F6C|nr:hypothetical protein [Methylotenera sp.]
MRPSKMLTLLFIIVGLFFGLMVLSVPLPLLQSTVLLSFTVFSTCYFVLRDALLALPWSWQAFALDKTGNWYFTQHNGICLSGAIAPDSFVSAYLTVLHVVPKDYRWFKFWQHRYVLLLQDNSNAELFRKLRVCLLWGKKTKTAKL